MVKDITARDLDHKPEVKIVHRSLLVAHIDIKREEVDRGARSSVEDFVERWVSRRWVPSRLRPADLTGTTLLTSFNIHSAQLKDLSAEERIIRRETIKKADVRLLRIRLQRLAKRHGLDGDWVETLGAAREIKRM